MFLHVSVCPQGGGGSASVHAGIADSPTGSRHPPPEQTPPPPLEGRHPSPAQCMLGYGQQAGSTHPTGMHTCAPIEIVYISLYTKQVAPTMGCSPN